MVKFKTIGIILMLLISNDILATTYYVSNNGDDTDNGLSASEPWLTIGKVNSSVFLPGDSILFNRNDTWNEKLDVPNSGVIGSNITFGAYGSGSKPIIDVLSAESHSIVCFYSYITFQDLILKNSTNNNLAIYSTNGSYGINVLRVDIFNSGLNGIEVTLGGGDILISDVKVFNTVNNGIYLNGSEFNKLSNVVVENCYVSWVDANDGIVVHEDANYNTAGSNFIFRNNYAEYCAEQGFDITAGSNITLINNISQNNGEGGVLVAHSADTVTIHSHTSLNEPTNPVSAAINISDGAKNVKLIYSKIMGDGYHLLRITTDNVEIYNNVFAWNGGGSYFDLANDIENVIVKNNIFTSLQESMGRMRFLNANRPPDYPSFEFDNNLYYAPDSIIKIYSSSTTSNYSLSEFQTIFGQGLNSFYAKPEFVDRLGSDFHLTSISPAIDMGADVGLNADFDSTAVPINLTPEIGAFEYSLPTLGIDKYLSSGISISPNPANNFLLIDSDEKLENVWVANAKGQRVEVEIVNNSVSTSSLKNGLYFLHFKGGNGLATVKFIVVH